MSRRRLSASKRLVFVGLASLLFFGATELAMRQLWNPEGDTTRFIHASVYWREKPDQDRAVAHKEENTTFRVTTDGNGLRPPWHESKEGTRVLAMGCSTTYGWGVGDSETFPYRLQEHLRSSGKTAQVINGGQPGYTSFQGLWLWDELLEREEADVVLLGFVVQDARRAAYTDLSQALLQNESLSLKSVLYSWTTYRFMQHMLGHWQVEAKECQQDETECPFRIPPEDYLDNLRTLVDSVRASGGTPVLFGYPLEVEGYTELHRAILRGLAEAEDIPHVDPSEVTRNRAEYYFANDRGHANAAGNDAVAQTVAQFLVAEGLIE